MKFRNRRNGIVLDMPDTFSGKNWEPVIEEPAPVITEKPKKKSSVKKTVKK